MASFVKVSRVGEAALLFEFTDVLCDNTQNRVLDLDGRLRAARPDLEIMPGIGNMLVMYNPLADAAPALEAWVRDHWAASRPTPPAGRLHDIPVDYQAGFEYDIPAVAQATGMTPDEVIERHQAAEYTVATLGAHPGYAYLLGLDERLFIPRRRVPRVSIPVNSIVIAGGMSGTVGCQSASGWHILGLSPVYFFDASRQPPALLAPGDRIRFHAI